MILQNVLGFTEIHTIEEEVLTASLVITYFTVYIVLLCLIFNPNSSSRSFTYINLSTWSSSITAHFISYRGIFPITTDFFQYLNPNPNIESKLILYRRDVKSSAQSQKNKICYEPGAGLIQCDDCTQRNQDRHSSYYLQILPWIQYHPGAIINSEFDFDIWAL